MRNRHLGDSLDLAKASLLAAASEAGLAVLVAPLQAEAAFDLAGYCRILGINGAHRTLPADSPLFDRRSRASHLEAITQSRKTERLTGLLLDPDSGLSRTCEDKSKYLSLRELNLLTQGSSVTWLLYHHQGTGGLTYQGAAALSGALWFYNFGKAAVLVGGKPSGARALLRSISSRLNPARCTDLTA